ncbi:CBM20 domain-containing protein [Tumidithrix helvetica PCC 7403]|uniref:DUF1796 family putative cysteine peptidase n=1 Tax=Tumidithrix helvetica TaxID=3457545 RepID=UPI003CBD1BEC
MYRFQIVAFTQAGDSIGLVGSTAELGQWDVAKCIRLRTSADRFPLWWTDTAIDFQETLNLGDCQKVEYKYVLFAADGSVSWEALGQNRWIPLHPKDCSRTLVVDDGAYRYLQPYPFGYMEDAMVDSAVELVPAQQSEVLKIAVIGSSVAWGQKAWLLKGWAGLLGEALQQKFGHQLVNLSEVGANVSRTIERFSGAIAPKKPDVVIIALSLGNEGLAHCRPHERRAAQRRFESGLQRLVRMTWDLGARPILGSVYPHGDYAAEHYWLLQDTHARMLEWDVPILNWLPALDNGQGRWKEGISFDPAHPNTLGHRLMYEAIALDLFQRDRIELAKEKYRFQQQDEIAVYLDDAGFYISACLEEKCVRICNRSPHSYTIAPYWDELQAALQDKAGLVSGIYIAKKPQKGIRAFFAVDENGGITTTIEVPSGADLEYSHAFHLFSPHNSQLLFYDGHLGILQADEQHLWIINESDHDYNIHPMWQEVRSAFKLVSEGVYEDPHHPDLPFRTLMVGKEGLESRVKIASRSAVLFQYKCKLTDISRVAVLPLGDRCAVRMMLYKMEYDGPAFPFDLTRTNEIGDVADAIANRFYDMWNPNLLHYSSEAGRIYHAKWKGLSFAHEVEDTDNPLHDMAPVHERMRVRYSARSERFWYAIRHSDKILFVRTGITHRGGAIDLVEKLENHCQGKPFHLLLLSPQPSAEFLGIPNVLHYDVEFNPDRMYEDLEYWMHCTKVMREILESLGVSSKNLFWCPPNPPKEKEVTKG